METWYLLFVGSSPDGLGHSIYDGRTTDKEEAIRHFEEIKSNPYSTGKVVIVTDEEYRVATWKEDFD